MTHSPRFYLNTLNYFSTLWNLTESRKSYSTSQFEWTPAGNNGAISAAYLEKTDKTDKHSPCRPAPCWPASPREARTPTFPVNLVTSMGFRNDPHFMPYFQTILSENDISHPLSWLHTNMSPEGNICCFLFGTCKKLNHFSKNKIIGNPQMKTVWLRVFMTVKRPWQLWEKKAFNWGWLNSSEV